MNEPQKIFWSILEKAAEDREFHAAMLADPKAAIGKEFDIRIPEGVEIVVHQNDAGTVHLPLPAKPEVLSQGSLREVSGGLYGAVDCASCL